MNKNLQVILQKEKLENLLPLFTSQNITDSCLSDLDNYNLPNNLWEWCFDLAEENFISHRRIRGGCWNYGMNGGIDKLRVSRSPDSLNDVVGFRIARNCK
jgi:hypothetical protein